MVGEEGGVLRDPREERDAGIPDFLTSAGIGGVTCLVEIKAGLLDDLEVGQVSSDSSLLNVGWRRGDRDALAPHSEGVGRL